MKGRWKYENLFALPGLYCSVCLICGRILTRDVSIAGFDGSSRFFDGVRSRNAFSRDGRTRLNRL